MSIEPLDNVDAKRFVVVVALFVLTLFASMKSLQHANVDTVICLRMTAPLILSFLDYFFLGRSLPSFTSLFSLMAVTVSFSIFFASGIESNATAVTWLSIWYAGLLFESVYVKHVVTQQKLTTFSQSFYQNVLSIPPLVILVASTEHGNLNSIQNCSYSCQLTILSSCILGLGMSFLSFLLRKLVSATSFTMVGNICKLATIAVNLLIWDKHANSTGTISVTLCIIASAFYEQAPLRKDVELGSGSKQVGKRTKTYLQLTAAAIILLGVFGSLTLFSGDRALDYLQPTRVVSIKGVSGEVFSGEKVRIYRSSITQFPFSPSISAFSDGGTGCDNWAVCTTIFEVSEAVRDVCHRFENMCLVVVSDRKTPTDYDVSGACTFILLSVPRQQQLSRMSAFADGVPWNHFGRKNLGYLFAIANGAQSVWDFDDDNLLLTSDILSNTEYFASESPATEKLLTVEATAIALNPYPLFGAEQFSWPRGFPLDLINDDSTRPTSEHLFETSARLSNVGVVQALANKDPDVDAIYRLQRELPFDFHGWSEPSRFFLVPSATFIPWNAQATLFTSREILWALYLPMSIHGRVSDIWRSYIVQRLFRNICYTVTFATQPLVVQDRNEHSYLGDFAAEQDLYQKSGKLLEFLDHWNSSAVLLTDQIRHLYVELYERRFVEEQDVTMINLWLLELDTMNYNFPSLCV